ncbi:acyltransferase family protein [Pirellulaceae bacterium SH501]
MTTAGRVASIDIYRGMVMFLMLAEVLNLPKLRQVFSEDTTLGQLAEWIRFHTSHVAWAGCSLHDLIQPSFSFLVGTSMAYSLTNRIARGDSRWQLFRHAILRSLILVFLGIFLRSLGKPNTNFTFDDTLTQIGLGYWALFLISLLSARWVVVALIGILVGYWGIFVLYPAPSSEFPYTQVGVPESWNEFYREGFAVHFNKNSNAAWAFDRWWMNLFPREKPFEYSGGGYATLSFIPTLGTMVLGLLGGRLLQSDNSETRKNLMFVASGLALMATAWLLDWSLLCPIVKRIWTPAWTLWSGGICLLWLVALHWIADQKGWARWSFPFVVIGSNSIVAYVLSWTLEKPTHDALLRHFGSAFESLSQAIQGVIGAKAEQAPMIQELLLGCCTLVVFWLILLWLYRRKVFVRI